MALKIIGIALGLLLVGFLATVVVASVRTARAERSHPPLGQFVDVDGHKVHAYVTGSGPALVLIHGASGNLRDFTFSFVDRVKDRFTVIAFDRPGLGYTPEIDPAGDSLTGQAALLHGALRALGYDHAIVLGQSFGGAVALRWGIDFPDSTDGLVLVGGVSNPWTTPLDPLYALNSSTIVGGVMRQVEGAFAPQKMIDASIKAVFAPHDPVQGYKDYIGVGLTIRPASLRSNARQVARLLGQVTAMVPDYGQLTMPVEIIHGDADTIVPASVHADVLVTQIPQANYTKLAGVGHMPHHVQPEAVTTAIDRIAAQLPEGQ